jgi:5-methylcytosine-specific restriction endonuclease McrA
MQTSNTTKQHGGLNLVDRTGHVYRRLTVIRRTGSKGTAAAWLCKCVCGAELVVSGQALQNGNTGSCGCSRRSGKGSRPNYTCRMPPGAASRNNVLKQYRCAARSRGIVWELTGTEFDLITAGNCAYCGLPPSNVNRSSHNGTFVYTGIDRVDNARGYVISNVVPCCQVCNHAKKDMSLEQFKTWIRRLVDFNGNVGPT